MPKHVQTTEVPSVGPARTPSLCLQMYYLEYLISDMRHWTLPSSLPTVSLISMHTVTMQPVRFKG